LFEGRGEAGADCNGESVEFGRSRLRESTINHAREPFMVQALGDIGDGATPTGMVAGLTRDYVGQDRCAAGNGCTSVVEAGFEG